MKQEWYPWLIPLNHLLPAVFVFFAYEGWGGAMVRTTILFMVLMVALSFTIIEVGRTTNKTPHPLRFLSLGIGTVLLGSATGIYLMSLLDNTTSVPSRIINGVLLVAILFIQAMVTSLVDTAPTSWQLINWREARKSVWRNILYHYIPIAYVFGVTFSGILLAIKLLEVL